MARDIVLGQTVVVKLEPLGTSQHRLEHEFSVYEKLGGGVGIPHVRWFGTRDCHGLTNPSTRVGWVVAGTGTG